MNQKGLVALSWVIVFGLAIATLSPLPMRPHIVDSANLERFAAFAAAGFLLGVAYPAYFLRVAFFIVGLAACLEAMQHLVPGRHGTLKDLSLKAVGGLAGLFVAGLILRWMRRAS